MPLKTTFCLIINTRIKLVKIIVHIIFKMPLPRKTMYLLIKSAVSEKRFIEKITNFKKPQITSLYIEIRPNFELYLYLNPYSCIKNSLE